MTVHDAAAACQEQNGALISLQCLTEHAHTPQQLAQAVPIGVGIDTSRYGHYAAFLQDKLQPAAAELPFAESADGYALLRQRFERIAQQYPAVHFHVRLDAAGQYADNLLHFLRQLQAGQIASPLLANATFTLSCGDPQRNKNYRAALYGAKKSDPVEARAPPATLSTNAPLPHRPCPRNYARSVKWPAGSSVNRNEELSRYRNQK